MARQISHETRRKDTRDKIELGGMIVKAGLHEEDKAVLLGGLMDLKARLQEGSGERERLRVCGQRALDDQAC